MPHNQLTSKIIGAAIEVHKHLGLGLLESTYEECLSYELDQRNIKYDRQKSLPINYKGQSLNCGYKLDLFVEGKVILELKSVESIAPIHKAQLLTYLKLSNLKLSLLINFNTPIMKDGIVRLVNNFKDPFSGKPENKINPPLRSPRLSGEH